MGFTKWITVIWLLFRRVANACLSTLDSCQTSDLPWHRYREGIRRAFRLFPESVEHVHHSAQVAADIWRRQFLEEVAPVAKADECPAGQLFFAVYDQYLNFRSNSTSVAGTLPKACYQRTSKDGRLACIIRNVLLRPHFRNLDILDLVMSGWPIFALIHEVVLGARSHKRETFVSAINATSVKDLAMAHGQSASPSFHVERFADMIASAQRQNSMAEKQGQGPTIDVQVILQLFIEIWESEPNAEFIPSSICAILETMPLLRRSAVALTSPQSALPTLLNVLQHRFLYTSYCPKGSRLMPAKGVAPFRLCVRESYGGIDGAMGLHGTWVTCEFLLSVYREFHGPLPSENPRHGRSCTIVDVGCHIGLCVLHFAVRGCRVVAIDIRKDHIEMLNISARLNGLEHQVIPVLAAMSDTTGGESVVSDGGDVAPQETHVCAPGDEHLAACVYGNRVPTWRLDDLLDSLGIPYADVNLLKVDAEGHDIQVLKGAEKTLSRRSSPPDPVVIFEMLSEFRAALTQFFGTQGFDVTERNQAMNVAMRSVELPDFQQG